MTESTRSAPRLNFAACLLHCLDTPELVRGFNRLAGRRLGYSARRDTLARMIDQATGHEQTVMESEARDLAAFIAFVDDCIWSRLPVECRDMASGPQPVAQQDKEG